MVTMKSWLETTQKTRGVNYILCFASLSLSRLRNTPRAVAAMTSWTSGYCCNILLEYCKGNGEYYIFILLNMEFLHTCYVFILEHSNLIMGYFDIKPLVIQITFSLYDFLCYRIVMLLLHKRMQEESTSPICLYVFPFVILLETWFVFSITFCQMLTREIGCSLMLSIVLFFYVHDKSGLDIILHCVSWYPSSLLLISCIFLVSKQVWPINVDLKFMEPVERELKSLGKVLMFLSLLSLSVCVMISRFLKYELIYLSSGWGYGCCTLGNFFCL